VWGGAMLTQDEFETAMIFVEEHAEALIRYFYSNHTESCIKVKIARIDPEDLWIMLDNCERQKILNFMKSGKIE
jgi:hypothetical protein